MSRTTPALSLLVLLAAVSTAAADPFTGFTSRAAWIAGGAAPDRGEDFNGFLSDASFAGATVALDGMTVTGGPEFVAGLSNRVDAPPLAISGGLSVDGSAYAAIDVFEGSSPRLDFVDPVVAWGALFKNAGDAAGVRVSVFDASDGLLGTLELAGIASGTVVFRGFTSGGALVDHLVFSAIDTSGVVNDLFGMDDVEYRVGAPVPEPGTLALLFLGLAGAALARRRRRGPRA